MPFLNPYKKNKERESAESRARKYSTLPPGLEQVMQRFLDEGSP